MVYSQVPPPLRVCEYFIYRYISQCFIMTGPARISVPGTNGFNRPFVVQESTAKQFKCAVASVTVPFTGVLSLMVTSVSHFTALNRDINRLTTIKLGPAEAPPATALQDAHQSSRKRSASPDIILNPTDDTSEPSVAAASKKSKVEPDEDWEDKDDDPNFVSTNPKKAKRRMETVRFLEAKLKLREGYEDIWAESKGRSFHAADIIRLCEFAADFIDDFNGNHTSTISVSLVSYSTI